MLLAVNEFHNELASALVRNTGGVGVGLAPGGGVQLAALVGLVQLDGVDGHIKDVLNLVVGGGVGHFRSFLLLVDEIILPGNYLKAHSYFKFVEKFFGYFKNSYVHKRIHVG